jgi:hypothetical protein
MTHHATADFWACYQRLPESVKRLADANDGDDGPVWFWIGSHAEYDRLIQGS